MKIDTSKTWTVETLTAEIAGNEGPIEFFRTPANKSLKLCWCGCGGLTKSRFMPGHDSRFHSLAKKVARGTEDLEASLANLPHDEARVEFQRHVDAEIPKHEEKMRLKGIADAAKAKAKADAEAAKATEPEVTSFEHAPAEVTTG